MDSAKVSVIIPAYNNEKYIEKCLQSVTEQSYENLEILVINDGSSDRTEELIRKCQQADERIQLLRRKTVEYPFPETEGSILQLGII